MSPAMFLEQSPRLQEHLVSRDAISYACVTMVSITKTSYINTIQVHKTHAETNTYKDSLKLFWSWPKYVLCILIIPTCKKGSEHIN